MTMLPSHQRVRRGLVRTFQINQLFDQFTPLETISLVVAQREGAGGGMWKALCRHDAVVNEAMALLAKLHLVDVAEQKTCLLPYGKRRLLEIAIALASRPRVLLLDEPVAGVPS